MIIWRSERRKAEGERRKAEGERRKADGDDLVTKRHSRGNNLCRKPMSQAPITSGGLLRRAAGDEQETRIIDAALPAEAFLDV
jgi:hypothetical protein